MQGAKFDTNITLEDDSLNWKLIPAEDGVPSYHVYTSPIVKSPTDNNEYRMIRLGNGLEAVIVHDGSVEKSVMNLRVSAGYFHDPDDMPGMANLCCSVLASETTGDYDNHTRDLFDYEQADHTGSDTDFLFVSTSADPQPALERLSSVFRHPQFDRMQLKACIHVLDSCHSDHLKDDDWRISSVTKVLAHPGHPFRKFGCGDKSTLMSTGWKIHESKDSTVTNRREESKGDKQADKNTALMGVRRRLTGWWEKEYCAGRMKFALIAKESLDKLTHLIVQLFSSIQNRRKNNPANLVINSPYGKEELGKIAYVQTIDDALRVTITFPVPSQDPLLRVGPCKLFSYLIHYRGPGSLQSYLTSKGWLSGDILAAEGDYGRGISSFEIDMELTKDGFKNYREVILTSFKYITLLHATKQLSTIQEEIIRMEELSFRYGESPEKDEFVRIITDRMYLPIPRARILANLTSEWNENLVKETLDHLVIENSLIMVTARDHTEIGKSGPWLTEPWHRALYCVEELTEDFISASKRPNDIAELTLPKPNKFIPKNIDVQIIDVPRPKNRPSLIKRTTLTELWYKKDDRFWVPKGRVMIHAWSPSASATAHSCVMTQIFAELVNDSLVEPTYEARRAHLWYKLLGDDFGLCLVFKGYTDKMQDLARLVLEKIKQAEIKKDRFTVMLEKEEKKLKESLPKGPFRILDEKLHYLLEESFSIEEKLKALKDITAAGLAEHAKALLSKLKFTMLVHGNFQKKDAFSFASMVEVILGFKPTPVDKATQYRTRLLPKSCNYIWELDNPEPYPMRSTVAYYCQFSDCQDMRTSVVESLLRLILWEHSDEDDIMIRDFNIGAIDNELRGLLIRVQSSIHPTQLEKNTEMWLRQMLRKLVQMDEGTFEQHKEQLISQWKEERKIEELANETNQFWECIQSGYYDFNHFEEDLHLAQSVTKEDVIKLYKDYIDPDSPTRSKLSIHVRSQSAVLSERAEKEFVKELRNAGIVVDEDDAEPVWEGIFYRPPVQEERTVWEVKLREQLKGEEDRVEDLLEQFDRIAKEYPMEIQGPVELGSDVVFIEDVDKFKNSLALSEYPKPIEELKVE